jgi:hypothetical protein
MDKLTMHYLANLSVAAMAKDVLEELDSVATSSSILSATGRDLEILIAPVLINGRILGNYATGMLSFKSDYAVQEEVPIAAGTKCFAILEDGTKLFFVTTIGFVIPVGESQADVPARAVVRGLSGNVGPLQIETMYSAVANVSSVINLLTFSGGTLDETDEALRKRYWDAVQAPGKATMTRMAIALAEVQDIGEVKIYNDGQGDFEILLAYSQGILTPCQDIIDALENNMGLGSCSRGFLGATIDGANVSIKPDGVYGGFVWFRPRNFIKDAENLTFSFKNMAGVKKNGIISIPVATDRGVMLLATFDLDAERAKSIISASQSDAGNSYDILVGMGIANHLYNLPEQVAVDVAATIRIAEEPEPNLVANIKTSLTSFLNDFLIDETLYYSDVWKFMDTMYDSSAEGYLGRAIIGITEIESLVAIGGTQRSQKAGDRIVMNKNSRIRAGNISINIVEV